jgi:hypothetical protein
MRVGEPKASPATYREASIVEDGEAWRRAAAAVPQAALAVAPARLARIAGGASAMLLAVAGLVISLRTFALAPLLAAAMVIGPFLIAGAAARLTRRHLAAALREGPARRLLGARAMIPGPGFAALLAARVRLLEPQSVAWPLMAGCTVPVVATLLMTTWSGSNSTQSWTGFEIYLIGFAAFPFIVGGGLAAIWLDRRDDQTLDRRGAAGLSHGTYAVAIVTLLASPVLFVFDAQLTAGAILVGLVVHGVLLKRLTRRVTAERRALAECRNVGTCDPPS